MNETTMTITMWWMQQFSAALPVFGRNLGLLVAVPFFSQRGLPPQVAVGLALFLTILVVSAMTPQLLPVPAGDEVMIDFLRVAAIFAGELLIGLAIGFVARLAFAAVQLAGQVLELPMGLALAGVLDPVQGYQIPLFGHFYYLLAAQVFFLSNGHLYLLQALLDSFYLVPPGTAAIGEALGQTVIKAFGWMFVTGVKIALPVVMAILITDLALGVAMRVVPQFNIFMVGFTLKIAVGFLAAALSIAAMVSYVSDIFSGRGDYIRQILEFIAGWQGR
ncbi:MAG TPA: flagellar biosynthetic protein FliR [Firmicutes bacterium]|nr:flagellar biosynthetic protein FliR [Bacillota bacterium]